MTRSSVAVMKAAEPKLCTRCAPGTSPHLEDKEVRYRRAYMHVIKRVCANRLEAVIDQALEMRGAVADAEWLELEEAEIAPAIAAAIEGMN